MRRCSSALISRIAFSRRFRSVMSIPVAMMYAGVPFSPGRMVLDHAISRRDPSLATHEVSYSRSLCSPRNRSTTTLKRSASSATMHRSQKYFSLTSSNEYPETCSQARLKRTILPCGSSTTTSAPTVCRIADATFRSSCSASSVRLSSVMSNAIPWINHGRPFLRRIIFASQ